MIHYEERINFNEYIDKDIFKGRSKYILKATINHIGSLNFGHYFCCIKINNIWFKFNDYIAEKMTEMNFISDSVYVLIYELEKYKNK